MISNLSDNDLKVDENISRNNEILNAKASELVEATLKGLESRDGWADFDVPKMSEEELLASASRNNLDNDEQTRLFIKFLSTATNFSSANFKIKLQTVPEIVKNVQDLIAEMKKEIKKFKEIAVEFDELVHIFIRIVFNTKHNLNMILPDLKGSILHMNVLKEASMPDSADPLKTEDKEDCEKALVSLSNGIKSLQSLTLDAKKESLELDNKITGLKQKAIGHKIVSENRIEFSKLLPFSGAVSGSLAGAGLSLAAIASPILGGTGALVIGGVAFPPLAAVVTAFAVSGVVSGGVFYLIKKLWDKHQEKALKYLERILFYIHRLQTANLAFMDYMNKSEENTNKIVYNLKSIQESIINGSQRYRKNSAGLCEKAIDSTNEMIQTIESIIAIDMNSWSVANQLNTSDSFEISKRKAVYDL